MQIELAAPNGKKMQLGARFHYLRQVTITQEMLGAIANGPQLFGEGEKSFREDAMGKKRDVVRCAIENIRRENGKFQAEELISGFAICHRIDSYQKLIGRKIAFARAIYELTRLNIPLCFLNGGPKEVRRKLWKAFLDNVKVLGYRKPAIEE